MLIISLLKEAYLKVNDSDIAINSRDSKSV
jgi:hypothetical protein